MLKINQTLIRRILLESVVNPNTPGPWKGIADMRDPEFFRKRAIECLQEAEYSNRDLNLMKAITLIALVRAIDNEP